MRTIHVKRLSKFRSCLTPFWVITSMPKNQFIELLQHSVEPDSADSSDQVEDCDFDLDLNQHGFKIWSGKERTVCIGDEQYFLYVLANCGIMSNEIMIPHGSDDVHIEISLKGGWSTPVCPILRVL